MKLYYTGASSYLAPQTNSKKSLGGLMSSTLVFLDVTNSFFSSIPNVPSGKILRETRCYVLKNETGADVTGCKIWYENTSSTPTTSLRMSLVIPGTDSCGNRFVEEIVNESASPIAANFLDNRGEINALHLPTILPDGLIGVWVERTINGSMIAKETSCDNLYQKYLEEPKQHIQELTLVGDTTLDPLSGKYWFLNTTNSRFYVWYDVTGASSVNPLISGREGIRVPIELNDTEDIIALKTKQALTNILSWRGECEISILPPLLPATTSSIISIKNTENGKIVPISVENSLFTVNQVQEGTSGELEGLEKMQLYISY